MRSVDRRHTQTKNDHLQLQAPDAAAMKKNKNQSMFNFERVLRNEFNRQTADINMVSINNDGDNGALKVNDSVEENLD